MSEVEFYEAGFDEFEKLLTQFESKADAPLEIMEAGVEEFVKDVRKLPKPRSGISKAGYTHLLDTVTHQKTNKDIEVGWGKYYGPMVERGTKKMSGTPHLSPTFERNKDRYYKIMIEKGGFK